MDCVRPRLRQSCQGRGGGQDGGRDGGWGGMWGVDEHNDSNQQSGVHYLSGYDSAHLWNAASSKTPQYASEDAELLLVGNKLDCETDREITRQQGEKVRGMGSRGDVAVHTAVPSAVGRLF